MPLLDRWEEALDTLETDVTDDDGQDVNHLVKTRRDLIVVRRLMLPQLEVVKRLMDSPDTDENSRIYYRDVLDHIDAVYDTTGLLLDVCAGTLQLHSNRANERLNAVMKYLAIVSTLMLPMTVISGVFGMNFDVIPGAHHQAGFWSAVGLMLASALGLIFWFRHRRWV